MKATLSPGWCVALACFACLGPFASQAADAPSPWLGAPLTPDEHTLLLAHFDGTADASHARGLGLSEGGGRLTSPGKFGGCLTLASSHFLAFEGRDHFPGEAGTIEFWLRPGWDGAEGRVRSVLSLAAPGKNQITINKLATGRFGAGMFGTPEGAAAFVYGRADADIRAWRAGEWHHVAVCWGGGELSLWLDGIKAASRSGTLPPQGVPGEIRLLGADCAVDEFCVSDVVRYQGEGRVAGQPVPARARLNPGWKFHEPAGVYGCELPGEAQPEAGLILLPKPYLDEAEPARLPAAAPGPRIDWSAAPGEQEPATFLLLAAGDLTGVNVEVSPLRGQPGTLDSGHIAVRQVVRGPMRKIYTAKAEATETVNRFLPRWRSLDLPRGEFREVWLQVDVPASQPPGVYEGELTISHRAGRRGIPVRLEVWPFRLREHPGKGLASYYAMEHKLPDSARLLRELSDLRAHGVRHLVTGLGIRYEEREGKITPHLDPIREALARLREAGFSGGTLVFETGFVHLARMLGHEDLGKDQNGASLDADPAFREIAREAMRQWTELQRETRDFRLVASHLDEVFGSRSLLDQYLRLSRAARQVPEVPLYITFNTRSGEEDALRRELDPLVDLRCHHGYTFEHWLARGHTMDEYEAELAASGDIAWFYHNARGPYWTAEWSRIINGVYLWASPFAAHCPWTYQRYFENPFDDTDGPATRGHDWGLSFPGPENPADLVPTRCYEAMREGWDDLRYLATLEHAIATAPPERASKAAGARRFLDSWRGLIRHARPATPADSETPGDAVDLDTGLLMGRGASGTAQESPLILALSARFRGEQWQQMRRDLASWILAFPVNEQ